MADHYLKQELYALLERDPAIFEFLQSASLDGLWYWNLENPEHEWMNNRFWEVLGYDPADKKHLAAEWQDMIHPDDLKSALSAFKAHAEDPETPYNLIVRYKHRDGSTVHLRCRGVMIRDESGVPIRMLGAHNELTEIFKLLEEAERQKEDLETLLHITSHDLRAPLRAINQFTSIIQKRYTDDIPERGQAMFQRVINATDKMNQLLEDLNKLFQAQNLEQPTKSIAPEKLFTAALSQIKDEVDASHATFEIQGPFPPIFLDPIWGKQVFVNLFSNAIKYTEKGQVPEIVVAPFERQEAEGTYTGIVVHDRGFGIPEEHHDSIFEMYRRGADHNVDGTGAGLAIVRRVLDKHGADIWVESREGGGSSFFIGLEKKGFLTRKNRRDKTNK